MKRFVLLAAKIGVTVLLLWLVGRKLDVPALLERIAALQPEPIMLAVLLVGAQTLLLVAWRWQLVLRVLGVVVPLRGLVALMMIGHFVNQALPATVGGDAMRIWLLSRGGPDTATALRSVVIERLIGMIALLLLALPGLPRIMLLTGGDLRGWSAMAMVVGCCALIAVPALVLRHNRWFAVESVRRRVSGLAAAMATVVGSRRVALLLVATSIAGHATNCVAIWVIAWAYGIPLSLPDALTILPTVFVMLIVPVSFGGWGLREGVMVMALALAGVAAGDAALISVTFGLTGLATGLPGALVWLFSGRPSRPGPAQTLQ